jgi:hypothetical protein
MRFISIMLKTWMKQQYTSYTKKRRPMVTEHIVYKLMILQEIISHLCYLEKKNQKLELVLRKWELNKCGGPKTESHKYPLRLLFCMDDEPAEAILLF